jgi:hypothetical protein
VGERGRGKLDGGGRRSRRSRRGRGHGVEPEQLDAHARGTTAVTPATTAPGLGRGGQRRPRRLRIRSEQRLWRPELGDQGDGAPTLDAAMLARAFSL